MTGITIVHLYLILISAFANPASAQNTTVDIFLPTAYENTIKLAASVIGVCNGRTTYGLRCTAGILATGFTCGSNFAVCRKYSLIFLVDLFNADNCMKEATVTEGDSSYVATKVTPFSSAIVTVTETCNLKATTEASCTATISISSSGKNTITSTSSVLSGTDIPSYYMCVNPRSCALHTTLNLVSQVPNTSHCGRSGTRCTGRCV